MLFAASGEPIGGFRDGARIQLGDNGLPFTRLPLLNLSVVESVLSLAHLRVGVALMRGSASALATLVAPTSASDAWLVFSALPLLVGTATVLVVLSVIATIAALRSHDDDEIVAPLQAHDEAKRPRGRHPLLIAVNWLFPLIAVVVFTMTWGFSLLRP